MNSAFTGKEFFSLPIERQIELLKHGNKVFCRTEPSDKQRLITMLGTHSLTYSPTHSPTHLLTHSPNLTHLEKLGEVIAMTGTYSLTHLLAHLLTYSLTYSLR